MIIKEINDHTQIPAYDRNSHRGDRPMTRDEQLIRAALNMAADVTDEFLWQSSNGWKQGANIRMGLAIEAIRAIDVDDVLATVKKEQTDDQ